MIYDEAIQDLIDERKAEVLWNGTDPRTTAYIEGLRAAKVAVIRAEKELQARLPAAYAEAGAPLT